jgi:hypothetical protein
MLCGFLTVQQARIGDCLSFDPFPFDQNGLAPPEVDIGWRQIANALMIAQVIVVGDEGLDLGFEIARQALSFLDFLFGLLFLFFDVELNCWAGR